MMGLPKERPRGLGKEQKVRILLLTFCLGVRKKIQDSIEVVEIQILPGEAENVIAQSLRKTGPQS